MNIEDRIREIVRDEVRPLEDLLRSLSERLHDSHMSPAAAGDMSRANASAPRDGWLTTAEAAELLHLSPQTLSNWRSLGTGPAYRQIGRAIRYQRAVVEAYGS